LDIHEEFCPDKSECPVTCNENCHILTNTSASVNDTSKLDDYLVESRQVLFNTLKDIGTTNDTCDEFSCPRGIDEYGCKRPTICIRKEININGEMCEEVCPATCDSDEIICAENQRDEFGCREEEACRNRTRDINGTFCGDDSICPAMCNITEVLCETGIDEVGCRNPDICLEPVKDIIGNQCPFDCPGVCIEKEILCPGHPMDLDGCTGQPTCYNRTSDDEGNFCPDSSDCPKYCNYTEEMCPTGLDDLGCKTPDVCIFLKKDINGTLCPFHCPGVCTDEEVLCSGHPIDINGCEGQPSCYNRTKDDEEMFCPDTSDCPIFCNQTEEACPTGFHEDGCKTPDVCIKLEKDINGTLCPFHCPGVCTDEEVLCSGHPIDEIGCEGQPSCYERTKSYEYYGGIYCPDTSNCPIFCNKTEESCPTGLDQIGCKINDVCIKLEKDNNGTLCPFHCPGVCTDEQVLCPGHKKDLTGCEGQATCYNRTKNWYGEYCPDASDCPTFCLSNEVRCPGELDENGCKIPDVCIPEERDNNGTLCPVQHCPIQCNETETFCIGRNNSLGCREEDICYPSGLSFEGEVCPAVCPVHCNSTNEVECEGQIEYRNETSSGCRGPGICRPRSVSEITGEFCSEKSDSHGCPINCPKNQILCPAKKDMSGCLEPAFCFHITSDTEGNYCSKSSICPTICPEDEMECYAGIDDEGCTKPDDCWPLEKDVNGTICPFHCPGICTEDEVLCEGHKRDIFGCTGQPSCYNITVGTNGTTCADESVCPKYCELDEYICPIKAPENGCNAPEECFEPELDNNGTKCSFHCPGVCSDDEVLCPGHPIDEVGCRGQPTCYNKTTSNNGSFCTDLSICPTFCELDEKLCDQGIDENGCRNAGLCIKQERDINGDLCPFECPAICSDVEVLCAGYRDDVGCKKPELCMARQNKTKGIDIGGLCPGFCPAECVEHEVVCFGHIDCDGCPTDETCWPAAQDVEGNYCEGDLASISCPLHCDEEVGEVLCPTYEPVWECKPMAVCKNLTKDYNGNYCHSHSVCPRKCESDEISCEDGIDSVGCQNSDLCLEKGLDSEGNFCARKCPPRCNDTQQFCRGSMKDNGCQDHDVCVETETDIDGDICPIRCPIPCTETEVLMPGERDNQNCTLPATCVGRSIIRSNNIASKILYKKILLHCKKN
jgi:hypothetical protein